MGQHIYAHALVAGEPLTADGDWVSTKCGILFPGKALSSVYRGKFMDSLDAARKIGSLRHYSAKDDTSWRTLRADLRGHDWAVYAKQPLGGPAQVLEYLGRYTHRVAISNERILGMDGSSVRFLVRDSSNGSPKKMMRLEACVFLGRFLPHVLPSGFKQIRHYGFLGAAHKAANLAAARAALQAPVPDPLIVESVEAFMQRVAELPALS